MGNEPKHDDDRNALSQLAERGLDMTRAVKFEFSIHVEDKEKAERVLSALKAAKLGSSVEAVFDEGELEDGEELNRANEEFWPSWTVYISRTMIPSYEAVVGFQKTLADVCQGVGIPDGWTVEI
jgi:Regulator of ribonuclease activity B